MATMVCVTYPTWLARLAVPHTMATMLYYISYLTGSTSGAACHDYRAILCILPDWSN